MLLDPDPLFLDPDPLLLDPDLFPLDPLSLDPLSLDAFLFDSLSLVLDPLSLEPYLYPNPVIENNVSEDIYQTLARCQKVKSRREREICNQYLEYREEKY